MAANGYELDWDSPIEQDEQQEFQLLPEGDYDFIVDHVDRGFVSDNSKDYAGMKQATAYLNIQVSGQEPVSVRENFIIHSNFAWKVGSFLLSVGLKKKGETVPTSNLFKSPGMRGRCHIVKNKGQNGREYNNVRTFYAPSDNNDSGNNQWAI